MKKLILTAIIISLGLSSAFAQTNPNRKEERLATYRAEVFTRVLSLTSEEARNFWPVYNDFLARRDKLRSEFKRDRSDGQMSDSEVETQLKRYFEKKQRDLDLEKDLYQNLRKVLPLQKIAKMPRAEREFREALVKKLQKNRQRRTQTRRGGRG